MKIRLNTEKDSNGSPIHTLFINDSEAEYIRDLSECPEDAHIGRDLIDGNDIIEYIKMGYEAAKLGDALEVEYTQEDL